MVVKFFNVDNLLYNESPHIYSPINPSIICSLLNFSMSTTLMYNDSPQYILALHCKGWDSIKTDSQTGDTDIVNQTNPFIPDLSYRSETSWLPIPSRYKFNIPRV